MRASPATGDKVKGNRLAVAVIVAAVALGATPACGRRPSEAQAPAPPPKALPPNLFSERPELLVLAGLRWFSFHFGQGRSQGASPAPDASAARKATATRNATSTADTDPELLRELTPTVPDIVRVVPRRQEGTLLLETADGRRLACKADGSRLRRVVLPGAQASGTADQLYLSPDLSRVAVAREVGGEPGEVLSDISVFDLDTGARTPIARGRIWFVAWTPDGAGVYYNLAGDTLSQGVRPGAVPSICAARIADLAWIGGGDRMAAVVASASAKTIQVLGADGTLLRDLTPRYWLNLTGHPEPPSLALPAVSPAGDMVAFSASYAEAPRRVYVSDVATPAVPGASSVAATAAPSATTTGPADVPPIGVAATLAAPRQAAWPTRTYRYRSAPTRPAFSPDSKRIAFLDGSAKDGYDLYVAPVFPQVSPASGLRDRHGDYVPVLPIPLEPVYPHTTATPGAPQEATRTPADRSFFVPELVGWF